MLREKEQVIHPHVLFIREVRLTLRRILISKRPHAIHELKHEGLIVCCHRFVCQSLTCSETSAL